MRGCKKGAQGPRVAHGSARAQARDNALLGSRSIRIGSRNDLLLTATYLLLELRFCSLLVDCSMSADSMPSHSVVLVDVFANDAYLKSDRWLKGTR